MDQDVLVNEQIDSGKHLIEQLSTDGVDVHVAFWAKPTEDGKWFLYLSSPKLDEMGPASAYRFIHRFVRERPSLLIDPLEIRVIRSNDSLTEAALAVTKPKVPNSPFAARNPKPYPRMTRIGGSTLAGVSIDGAYIYPPRQSKASV